MNHVMRIVLVALTFAALGACSGDDDSAEAPVTTAAETSSASVTSDEARTTEATKTSAETTVVTTTSLAPTTTTAAPTTTAVPTTTAAPTTAAPSFTPQESYFLIASTFNAKREESRQFLDSNGYLIPSRAFEYCTLMAPAYETFASEFSKVQWPAAAQDEAASQAASSAADAGVLYRCAGASNIDEAYTIFADHDWTTTASNASAMRLALGLPLG